jgi:RNA-directed DNA polymerase
VERLNRMVVGWANYFCLGRVRQAYRNVNFHAVKRLRQWLCHKHQVRGQRGATRFSDKYLHEHLGLINIETLIRNRPWAKA